MDPSSSSSPYSTPDISSVPFPRQPRPRFGPRSPSQRPTALIVSDLGPPALHQRHHTEPALVNHHGFDAELDAAEHSFFDVPYSFAVSRPSSPAPTDYSLISPPLPDPESDPGPQAFRRRRRHRRFHTIYDGPPSPRVMKRILPRLWGALSSPARKSRTKSVSAAAFFLDPHLSYADLPPLDGEEGELVDDEACFMGSDGISAKSGIDVVSMLPSELCILVFRHLDLASILACQRVNREWRRLADDNAVWRDLFFRRDGWHIDLELAQARGWTLDPTAFLRDDYFPFPHQRDPHSRLSLPLPPLQYSPEIPSPYATPVFLTPAPPSPIVLLPSPFSPERPTAIAPVTPPSAQVPLTLPWRALYRTRQTLDDRWASPAFPPQTMRLTGHTNSVYCVEFDSARIVTGARDHTVRVWRIADGACLGTFHAHTASVLCLKFEKDWDVARPAGEPGLLVTGSSDRTVRVWDMRVTPSGAVEGTVRGVLEGHRGGVLDLRVDERWIVSSSKDARVCVWDRSTLALHRTLVGHEGPVNSIAMQAGRLVSASGDGRIMFWDAASGECLRVFDHLRGLACVEYKGDLIVSGSNDAKIKVWSASTGECVRTLAGHSDLVRALAFDPDSGRLVSASYDMSVRVWDVREGRLVREFLRHQGSHILDVKFDARKIVSVSFDKTILVTDFSEGLDAELFV